MMDRLFTLKEACRILGIHPNTLRKWDRNGKIRVVRTIGGRRRIPESEIKRLLGINESTNNNVAIYVRVSSYDQKKKGDLDRQKQSLLEYAKAKNYNVTTIIEDIASGLNENRKGLSKLFDLVNNRKISVVIVSFKDRLTRFGFKYIEKYFSSYNVKIEIVNTDNEKDAYQELVEDLIAIVSSFAGRLYGLRSHRYKKVVEGVKELVTDN